MTTASEQRARLERDLDRWIAEIEHHLGRSTLWAGMASRATVQFEAYLAALVRAAGVELGPKPQIGPLVDALKQVDSQVGLDDGRRALTRGRRSHLESLVGQRNKHAHIGLDEAETLGLLRDLREIVSWRELCQPTTPSPPPSLPRSGA